LKNNKIHVQTKTYEANREWTPMHANVKF